MAESKESPPVVSCFPVTQEVANAALASIANDPDRVRVREGSNLQRTNPEINSYIFGSFRTWPVDAIMTAQGALWTHLLLRMQVEAHGGSLPQISTEQMDVINKEIEEDIIAIDPKVSANEFIVQQYSRLAVEEPHLGSALSDISKYFGRQDKLSFMFGAISVYFPIKSGIEAKQFSDKFSLD